MSDHMDRRQFLGRAMVGGAALAEGIGGIARAASLNERVVVGVAGMSRGRSLALTFAGNPHCLLKYVCDVDRRRAEDGAKAVEKETGQSPAPLTDLRRMLDNPEVDAVVFALPVHWHAPAAILACQAGKHVYVEKPCSHNPHEGELLIAAARKHDCVVQMGNQRRASEVTREAMRKLHEGILGRCYYARGWYASMRGSIGRGREAPVPEHLDYEMWQGPAPRRPYKDNVVHYNWHWFWHWGAGEIGNNGTHGLDLCRWGLNVDYPVRVNSAGGRFRYDDDQETPDTHMVSYDFAGGKMISWEGLSCNHPGPGGSGFGVIFFGENGNMSVGDSFYRICDNDGKVLEEKSGNRGDVEHIAIFLEAVQSKDRTILTSEIEEGHKSTLLSHLGNIAYRTGRSLKCGEKGHILDDAEAEALWKRAYEPGWEPTV